MAPLPFVTVPQSQSDNWTDDPSFDFAATPISLGSSSSSSNTPFYGSSSKARGTVEQDDDDWDLPADPAPLKLKSQHQYGGRSRDFSSASTPSHPHTQQKISHRPRTSTSSLIESGQVIGTGPKGVGVIRKLGSSSKSSSSSSPAFFQRAVKQNAVDKDWESDIDFDDVEFKPRPQLALSPSLLRGNVNDLDDLEDFLDGEDDRGQDTLKAGNTIKGLLPPPKAKTNNSTIKASVSNSSLAAALAGGADDDYELESAFSLPLTLNHLSLASASSSPGGNTDRPRTSQPSAAAWDSPATSTYGKSFSSGPSGRSGRSETSATSFSAGLTTDIDLENDVKILGARAAEEDEVEEDMEDGLELPTPSFFSSGRVNELNLLLDRKRKQAPPQPYQQPEESFEEGLVLSGRGTELTKDRLAKNRKARTLPLPSGAIAGARRTMAMQGRATTGRDRDREREREQGWNRPKSPGANSILGLRSQSATGTAINPAQSSYRRTETPRVHPDQSFTNVPLGNQPRAMVNIPPPTPSTSFTGGSMRLKHQKSQQRLTQPPQSPSLSRKQSLASLQDALATNSVPFGAEADNGLGSMRRKSNMGLMLPPATPSSSQGSRLTMPTASTRAKARPAVNTIFPRSEPRPVVAARVMNAPKRVRTYGDGTELEGIEDLSVDREREASKIKQTSGAMRVGLGRPSRRAAESCRIDVPSVSEKRKKTPTTPATKRVVDATKTKAGRPRKQALLIKNLGGVDKPKVVGGMTWNPEKLLWEGNEHVLRDFNTQLGTSVRPALIAHYAGSSIGAPSPTVGATHTVRIEGDMRFDPERMCWVSNLAPEDDEPDPFEGMADDEDDQGGGSTITRAFGRKIASTVAYSGAWSSRMASESSASTSMGSTFDGDDERLWEECKAAEERHRSELRGWTTKSLGGPAEARERERREEKRLWEIRNLAMRS